MSIFNRIVGGRILVDVGHTTLEYRKGQLSRALPSGEYRRRSSAMYVTVDLREQLISVALQEVLTSDAIPIRVSMSMRIAVVDAVRYTEIADTPIAMVYLAAQIALRKVCAQVTANDLIARGDALDIAPVVVAARSVGATVGVEVRDVVVKDIVVPAEIRAAAMEMITAKARGQAKVESARAETAALRAMANAGRMLDASPALAQLRLVQSAPYGARVVLAVGGADPGQPSDD